MTNIRRNVYIRMVLATVFLIAALFLPLALMAADTTSDLLTPENATSFLTPVINILMGKFGWFATFLVVVGILRLVIKPVMTIWESIVQATPSTKDDEFPEKFQSSATYRWILYILEWLGSFRTPSSLRTGADNPITATTPKE